jgi:hypothetical protein
MTDLFGQKKNERELLDALDFQIEQHTKRSRALKEQANRNKQIAAELAEDDVEDAAKKRLAVYLLCKQFRNKEESIIADMEAAKLQLVMKADTQQADVIQEVNGKLQNLVAEGLKAEKDFNKMTSLTQVNVEQSMVESESYGLKEKSIEEEFRKLKGQKECKEPSTATAEATFPRIPRKEPETATAKDEKQKETN